MRSILSWRSVCHLHNSSLSPPLQLLTNLPRTPLAKLSETFQPLRRSSIYKFMGDSNPKDSVVGQLNVVERDEIVNSDYAEFLVIRHGETEWNSVGRIQGHLDVDLNDVGRQQAFAVADRLSREPKISAVYSSDLKRASYTAEIIAKACGVLEVIKDPGFRERHLGDLQGVVYQDIAKVSPEAHKAFTSNRKDQELPGGGESLNQLYERCTSALQKIAKKHIGQRVVIVSHGGTIRALHRRAASNGRVGRVLNTSINVIHVSKNDEWSVKSWGDVSHLNQTGFLESGFGGDRNSG